MILRIARTAARIAGVDYAALRRAHRATWKWSVRGSEWRTGSWGVSTVGTGFDVTCRCGWESRTGGALHGVVAEMHDRHVADMAHAAAAIPAAADMTAGELAGHMEAGHGRRYPRSASIDGRAFIVTTHGADHASATGPNDRGGDHHHAAEGATL